MSFTATREAHDNAQSYNIVNTMYINYCYLFHDVLQRRMQNPVKHLR